MELKTKAVVVAACALMLASVAGCGGESSGGLSSSGASSTGAPQSGGTAADTSKTPVVVGFENALNGAYALPDVKKGFDAGVAYVNAELGGINGSPFRADTCGTDGSPDAAVNCGNTFVQDKVVLATIGFDYGADGVLPVLKGGGIATFGYQAVTPGLNTAVGQAYFGSPSLQESFSAGVVVQHERGVNSLATVMPDVPSMREYFPKVIEPAARKLGMTARPFYYPATTDWTSFASTVVSTKPDGMTVYAADSGSLAAIPAIRAAGFTGVIDASTSTTIVDKLSAATLKDVLFVTPYLSDIYEDSALSSKVKADLVVFERFTKPTDLTIISYAQFGFFTAVQSADMLRQVAKKVGEPLTAASVLQNLSSTKGTEFFRDTKYDCSAPSWPGTTSCSTGVNYGEVTGDKKLKPVQNSPIDVQEVRPAS